MGRGKGTGQIKLKVIKEKGTMAIVCSLNTQLPVQAPVHLRYFLYFYTFILLHLIFSYFGTFILLYFKLLYFYTSIPNSDCVCYQHSFMSPDCTTQISESKVLHTVILHCYSTLPAHLSSRSYTILCNTTISISLRVIQDLRHFPTSVVSSYHD